MDVSMIIINITEQHLSSLWDACHLCCPNGHEKCGTFVSLVAIPSKVQSLYHLELIFSLSTQKKKGRRLAPYWLTMSPSAYIAWSCTLKNMNVPRLYLYFWWGKSASAGPSSPTDCGTMTSWNLLLLLISALTTYHLSIFFPMNCISTYQSSCKYNWTLVPYFKLAPYSCVEFPKCGMDKFLSFHILSCLISSYNNILQYPPDSAHSV